MPAQEGEPVAPGKVGTRVNEAKGARRDSIGSREAPATGAAEAAAPQVPPLFAESLREPGGARRPGETALAPQSSLGAGGAGPGDRGGAGRGRLGAGAEAGGEGPGGAQGPRGLGEIRVRLAAGGEVARVGWPEREPGSLSRPRRPPRGRTDRRQGGPACPLCCTPPCRCSWAPR